MAINVLGRIGQETLKLRLDTPEMELAAVNDIGSHEGKTERSSPDESTHTRAVVPARGPHPARRTDDTRDNHARA